jgi:hypothetical protein
MAPGHVYLRKVVRDWLVAREFSGMVSAHAWELTEASAHPLLITTVKRPHLVWSRSRVQFRTLTFYLCTRLLMSALGGPLRSSTCHRAVKLRDMSLLFGLPLAPKRNHMKMSLGQRDLYTLRTDES